MLSDSKVDASKSAYYLKYLGQGLGDSAEGWWMGRGATALGLGGRFDLVAHEASFTALMAGYAPPGLERVEGAQRLAEDGPWKLVGNAGEARDAARDFTFSVPKSVSVVALLSDDPEIRDAIVHAHEAAVRQAISWLEDNATTARRGKAGRLGHVKADLIAVAVNHTTSRALDPQLHSHVLIFNAGRGNDGKWSALDFMPMYRNKKGVGGVYHAALAKGLERAGFRLTASDDYGQREIADVDEVVVKAFSTRRRQILEELERVRTDGEHLRDDSSTASLRTAAQAANLATRQAKIDVEWEENIAEWQRRLGRISRRDGRGQWSPSALSALRGDPRDFAPEIDHTRVLDALLTSSAAFTRSELILEISRIAPHGLDREEIDRLANEVLAGEEVVPLVIVDVNGSVLAAGRSGTRPYRLTPISQVDSSGTATYRYTTKAMLVMEAQLSQLATLEATRGPLSCDAEVILAREGLLTEDQRNAAVAILKSKRFAVSLQGAPGTSKSFTLRPVVNVYQESGRPIIATAVAARRAKAFGDDLGVQGLTIAKLLLTWEREGCPEGAVVLIDEASMVSTPDLFNLSVTLARKGGRLILAGDTRQLGAVEVGGGFGIFVSQGEVHTLTQNHRQANEHLREVVEDLHKGRVGAAINALVQRGNLVFSDSPVAAASAIVAEYFNALNDGVEVGMAAYTRDDVAVLNAIAADRLRVEGRVTDARMIEAGRGRKALSERELGVGDVIVCLKNDKNLGVLNGSRGVICGWMPNGGIVAKIDNQMRALPRDYVRDAVDLGYALTLHKSQGDTLGKASIARTDGMVAKSGRMLIYGAQNLSLNAALVAASRGTDDVTMYSFRDDDDDPKLSELDRLRRAWTRGGEEMSGLEELDFAEEVEALAQGDRRPLIDRRNQLQGYVTSDREGARTQVDLLKVNREISLIDSALERWRRLRLEAEVISPRQEILDLIPLPKESSQPTDAARWRGRVGELLDFLADYEDAHSTEDDRSALEARGLAIIKEVKDGHPFPEGLKALQRDRIRAALNIPKNSVEPANPENLSEIELFKPTFPTQSSFNVGGPSL